MPDRRSLNMLLMRSSMSNMAAHMRSSISWNADALNTPGRGGKGGRGQARAGGWG
jgi:hypothetical protein